MVKKTLVKTLMLLGGFLFVSSVGYAADYATPKEAESNAKKAIAYFKEVGREKAFEEFNKTDGKFTNPKKGLYVSVYDFDGNCLSKGDAQSMIGKNFIDLKDVDGFPIIKSAIDVAKTKGKGWIYYKWENKSTKQIEKKSTYVQRIGKEDLVIGCGAYVK